MGCLDSFQCCSFPHGRDKAVQIAMLVSTVAWICTIASLDAHGTWLSTISWLLIQSMSCTTLSVTGLSCAALSCLITAAYNVRAIWLIAHIFGECRDMQEQLQHDRALNASATEFDITIEGHNETLTEEDVAEMNFLCGDLDYFLLFAVVASPLWLIVAASVFYIPQPGQDDYTTLMDYFVVPSSSSTLSTLEENGLQPPQPVTRRLFRGCCRTFKIGSFPHGKNNNLLLVLALTAVSTSITLARQRLETATLALVATGIVWAATTTTIAPVVLHLAAMLGLLTSFFGFQSVYYIHVLCPDIPTAEEAKEWIPDYCQYPTYFTVLDLLIAVLWLMTGILIFTIPPPPPIWEDWENTSDGNELALQEEEEDDDHVELEDMKAGAMT